MNTVNTATHSDRRAIGLFPTRSAAERALYKLRDSNFNMDRVSVIARAGEDLREIGGTTAVKTNKEQAKGGAEAGATAGAVTGGAVGVLGTLGVLAIPGVGVAAEVGLLLASALIGGGVGAASGGLLGALIGWGVPEERAKYYDDRVNNANEYLVVVEGSEADMRTAEAILNEHGIRDWEIYSTTAATRV